MSPVSTGPTAVPQLQQQIAPASKSPASTPARIRKDKVYFGYTQRVVLVRGSVRSRRGLGPTMTARGQSIGISIGMVPQTLIMLITVQKTSKYYTTEFDLEEGFF